MKLIASKISRILKSSITIPSTCNFIDHMPHSLDHICDCKYECKFPPKGGPPNIGFIYNLNPKENIVLPSNMAFKVEK